MRIPSSNSGLRDNHTRGSVADFLTAKIKTGSTLSVVSAYFTIYAYDALKDSLNTIDHLDFLFGEPSFVNRLDPSKTEKKAFIIDADGLELSNKLQQKRAAKECANWIERKVDIKTIKQSNLLHGKMYHVGNGGVEDAILGSSNFTVRGLGLGNGESNIELNLIVDSNRDRLEERITAFEKHLDDNPDIDYESLTPDQFEDPDFDEEDFTIGGRRRIHLAHLKLPEWLKEVRNDRTQLQFLLEKTQSVTAKRDGKLAELKSIIEAKVGRPSINRDGKANRKVLVFTAFADTARYVHEHLEPWARNDLKIHIGLVCGDGGTLT